jgi:phosphoglycerate kinase
MVSVPRFLPTVAGRLMERELAMLESLFLAPERPITAVVGGAKVSSKLELLENLIGRVDNIVIGGAMANTFLLAQGHSVGKSLVEPKLKATAKRILAKAEKSQCRIILPSDVMLASPSLLDGTAHGVTAGTCAVGHIPAREMILDVGNQTLRTIASCLSESKTVVWNGPMGLFETRPFDVATLMIAREIAALTQEGRLKSIAGGGDTVAALSTSGLTDSFTYVSTAGGAFLEWLEGKTLPGVAALASGPAAKSHPVASTPAPRKTGRRKRAHG